MANNDQNINDTIANMITNLKPKVGVKLDISTTPLKRRFSSASNSSFDETPSAKRAKNDSILDVSYVGSPREVRRMRADLLSSRNRILTLENQIQHMHGVRKEMQIMFDNETATLRSQHERDTKSIEELENQLQNIRKREMALKSELSDAKNKTNLRKISLEAKIEELEKMVYDVSSNSKARVSEDNDEMNRVKKQVIELESMYSEARDDLDVHKNLLKEMEKKLKDQTKLQQELDTSTQKLQKVLLEMKELEYIKQTNEEIQQLAKSQQHKLSTYNDLTKENVKLKEETKRLKDEVHNKLLLEEEVHDLKSRLVTYKENEKKLAVLQVNKSQNEMYLSEWRAVASGICETTAPDTTLQHMLRSLVERLQQQEINLTSEKMDLEQKYKTTSHELKLAQSELEKNHKLLADLQSSNQQRQNLIHRMQKKLLLISKERDSYRKQLDSYEKDLTICMTPASMAQPGANQLQTQKERIESLERVIDGYQELIAKLESDLQRAEPAAHAEMSSIKTEQTARLQTEIEQLRVENEVLRERKDRLEIQLEDLLVGQDVVKERVVHSTINPLAESIAAAEKEKEKLQEEVDKLKRKVRLLEEGLEASRLNESTISSKEVQSWKEQLKNSELQVQRLKDYFKSSLQEFRNVIYMLLGYKVDKSSSHMYKLTSMYADRAEDQLCFQVNSEGVLNLLENEFSAGLGELVDLYLQQQHSIPMFLSAITTELFNNKTVPKAYVVDDDEDEDDD